MKRSYIHVPIHINLIHHKCTTINKMRLQFHCIMLINSYNRQNTLFKMTKAVELFSIRLVLLQFGPLGFAFCRHSMCICLMNQIT